MNIGDKVLVTGHITEIHEKYGVVVSFDKGEIGADHEYRIAPEKLDVYGKLPNGTKLLSPEETGKFFRRESRKNG